MKKIKVLSCVFTFAIMALIFCFSSQTAKESASASSGLTYKIATLISLFIKSLSADAILLYIHGLVRKLAHFVLFFVLGLSVSNTSVRMLDIRVKPMIWASIGFCVFYAITDEIHQMFVPGRAAQISDVFIDSIGAAAGCLLFFAIRYIFVRRRSDGI